MSMNEFGNSQSSERRYFLLGIGNSNHADDAFFQAIAKRMKEGEFDALLNNLFGTERKNADVQETKQPTSTLKTVPSGGIDAVIEQICRDGVLPYVFERARDVALTSKDKQGRSFWTEIQFKYCDLSFKPPTTLGAMFREWDCKPWRRSRLNLRGVQFPPLDVLRAKFDSKDRKRGRKTVASGRSANGEIRCESERHIANLRAQTRLTS